MYLIFDTETTGIPHNKTAPITDLDNWPRVVQLAWQLHDQKGRLLSQHNYIIKPEGFDIPTSPNVSIVTIGIPRALRGKKGE